MRLFIALNILALSHPISEITPLTCKSLMMDVLVYKERSIAGRKLVGRFIENHYNREAEGIRRFSELRSGLRGRGFESRHPDYLTPAPTALLPWVACGKLATNPAIGAWEVFA